MTGATPRVLQVVLNLEPGGTERLVIELVRRLHRRFPTAVCCLDKAGQWAAELTAEGVEVVALGREPGFHLATARRLRAIATARRATVLHCHHYSPFVYGRLASVGLRGVRVVFTEHGRLSDAPPSPKRRVVNHLLPLGVRDLYAVSNDLRRHLVDEGFPSRMGVIWNGIDPGPAPDEARRTAARAMLGIGPEERLIGSVGRLDPVKDFQTLIAAFAMAHARDGRLRLVIAGEGPERDALVSAVRKAGVEQVVQLLGHRSDVRVLLPAMDVYVNSSVTEGVSLTLLEAMAAERPIVATGVGGTPEVVVDGETGLLCAARAPAALAERMLGIAGDAALAARLGAAGRRRVLERFTLDRMVDAYTSVYLGSGGSLLGSGRKM